MQEKYGFQYELLILSVIHLAFTKKRIRKYKSEFVPHFSWKNVVSKKKSSFFWNVHIYVKSQNPFSNLPLNSLSEFCTSKLIHSFFFLSFIQTQNFFWHFLKGKKSSKTKKLSFGRLEKCVDQTFIFVGNHQMKDWHDSYLARIEIEKQNGKESNFTKSDKIYIRTYQLAIINCPKKGT